MVNRVLFCALAAWLVGGADTTLIANALVVDGSGHAARRASVRIAEGRIVAVGRLRARPGETVVGAHGLVLAPGFIDTHAHYDDGIFAAPEVIAAASQGITTAVVGQDGASPFPLADFFARLAATPPAINIAAYAGHGTLRSAVMGEDFRRAATPAEVDSMAALLRRELAAGALGLSTGLEYDPGIYSRTDELVALARVSAAAGGRYISHLRSEDRRLWDAVDEVIAIGRAARVPVQVSHAKLAMRSLWGRAGRLLARLDRARAAGVDVTADVYPYTYWQSGISVLFPERDFTDRGAASLVLREVAAAEDIRITGSADSSVIGRTVAEVARARGADPVTTLLELTRSSAAAERAGGEPAGTTIIATSMAERDVARLIAWPHANICSDGASAGGHPRGYGAFPRVLGRYVRERHALTLEAAVRKMTSLAAEHVGIRDRGRIAPGMRADLVLFDAAVVGDRATPADPTALAAGIAVVWVNGVVVYRDGAATGARPGMVVRR
jgi:N-acyl-D-amino-acid deacylase